MDNNIFLDLNQFILTNRKQSKTLTKTKKPRLP